MAFDGELYSDFYGCFGHGFGEAFVSKDAVIRYVSLFEEDGFEEGDVFVIFGGDDESLLDVDLVQKLGQEVFDGEEAGVVVCDGSGFIGVQI